MASIALLALLALQADISSRVRVTGAASLVFAALLPQAAAVAAPVGPPAGAALASVAEMRAAVLQRGSRLDRTESSQAALDALLDGYVAAHPVDAPARNCAGALARGSWRVMHAPHIEKLGATLGARFDVRYEFDDGDAIRSDVRYTGLWGEGWLSTRGRWSAADDDTVRLSWDEVRARRRVGSPRRATSRFDRPTACMYARAPARGCGLIHAHPPRLPCRALRSGGARARPTRRRPIRPRARSARPCRRSAGRGCSSSLRSSRSSCSTRRSSLFASPPPTRASSPPKSARLRPV